MTDVRQQRGIELATARKISKRDGKWIVPSQSGEGRYTVTLGRGASECHCTCPDHELRLVKCKHMFAVEYSVEHRRNRDGTETVTRKVTVTESGSRPTYPQNWPAYNAAQTREKAQFQLLLRDLCAGIPEPVQTMGRPRLPLCDSVFSAAFKVYSTLSARRFTSDLCDAQAKGYIAKVPHYNSVFKCFESSTLTPILHDLIVRSSLPLSVVETDFAADSTGFGSSRFVTWFNQKYGHTQDNHDWVKVHAMVGVKTNIVTSAVISGRFANDVQFLPELIQTTAENFQITKVLADKGYSSRANLEAVVAAGATPYIAFRNLAKADRTSKHRVVKDTLWTRMCHYYHYKRDEFLEHYHKRSNIESTFMAIKTKFGDSVRSRTDVAQANEVLAKLVCHNICVVIQSVYELGIPVQF